MIIYRVTFAHQDMEKLIQRRMMEYLQSAHGSLITGLQERLSSLTKENEEWRKTAREMQSKILELTIVQQRQTRRAASISRVSTVMLLYPFYHCYLYKMAAICSFIYWWWVI